MKLIYTYGCVIRLWRVHICLIEMSRINRYIVHRIYIFSKIKMLVVTLTHIDLYFCSVVRVELPKTSLLDEMFFAGTGHVFSHLRRIFSNKNIDLRTIME
jgi:hypothetical protein